MWYNCKCKRKTNSNLKVWYIMKNTIIKSILAVILGLVIGIFSKWGDVMSGDNVISYFGLISTGLVIWLAIGTLLIFPFLFVLHLYNYNLLFWSLCIHISTTYK